MYSLYDRGSKRLVTILVDEELEVVRYITFRFRVID